MTRNLENADLIAKLLLSAGTIILFFAGVIAGPFAQLLVVLSFVIIGLFVAKVILRLKKGRR